MIRFVPSMHYPNVATAIGGTEMTAQPKLEASRMPVVERHVKSRPEPLLCPAAAAGSAHAVIFGVVEEGGKEAGRVRFLRQPIPAALAAGSPKGYRFAAACAGSACEQFDGSACRTAQRLVQLVPAAPAPLPECILRVECQWWNQEGRGACLRCTRVASPSLRLAGAARVM